MIVLGLGRNGHLGFNEPGSEPNSVGRVLDLEPVSVEANTLWFGGDFVPSQGVTLGLRTILAARHILVVAFGSHKADVMGKAACGKEDLGCPASFLQRCHNVEFYVDAAAAKNVGTHFRKKLQS